MSLSARAGLLALAWSSLFALSSVPSVASADFHDERGHALPSAAAGNETRDHRRPHDNNAAATSPEAGRMPQDASRRIGGAGPDQAHGGSGGRAQGLQPSDRRGGDFEPSGLASRNVGPFSAGAWQYAHATFYGDETVQDTMQGACGYQNLWQQGYGSATTALSTTLFNGGFACGSCFEIRCVGSWACSAGNPSTRVTATNFCPPNWARPTNNGGWCNPPRQHFDMAKPAFEKIAYWRAGIVPIAYRRVPCRKQGNMEFLIEGNQWWHIVFITNVGGPGDIGQVFLRGSKSNLWVRMIHNWGAGYQVFHNFLGESLSFMVVSNTNYEAVVSWDMVPSNWQLGRAYVGSQFQLSP